MKHALIPATPPREVSAHRVLFPAALICGGVTIPLWTALYQDRPELRAWHAHEMLFGYALAVIGGFLLARIRRDALALLLLAWTVARFAPLLPPELGAAGAVGFAGGLAWISGQRFLRAARKGRNRMFAVMLIGMAIAELLYQAGQVHLITGGEQRGIALMLDLLALIMLQMGGRVIPAATAGEIQRRGGTLAERVQPALEAAIGTCMALMIVLDQFAALQPLAGAAALAAALIALLRLARWRGWQITRTPDLLGLHIGYAWVIAGLALKGAAQLAGAVPEMAGVHALGVGAIGTLTLVMITRTVAAREKARVPVPQEIGVVIVLTGGAALLRIVASFNGSPALIAAAAGCWTAAVVAAAVICLRLIRRASLAQARRA